MVRIFVRVGLLSIGALLVAPSMGGRGTCAATEEGCSEGPQCPDIYPSNVRAWYRVDASHTTDTQFYLKAPHILENGPKWYMGLYNFETSDEGKAPDGSFWKVVNSYWKGQCFCVAGLDQVRFSQPDLNRWTIQRTRAPAPPSKQDDPAEGGGTCDGGPCGGGEDGGYPPGTEAGFADSFQSPAPESPGSKWVCTVTDWYYWVDGRWQYDTTTLNSCWLEEA